MKKYIIVKSIYIEKLEERVTNRMNEGWTCSVGGFCVIKEAGLGKYKYFQSMEKYDKEKK